MAMKRLMLSMVVVSAWGCDTTKCPDGTFRVGSTCRKVRDAGSDVEIPDTGAPADGDDARAESTPPDASDRPDSADGQLCGTESACTPGETTNCVTACGSEGTGTCTDSCSAPSPTDCVTSAETCNGTDDDCDGLVDEELLKARPALSRSWTAPQVTTTTTSLVSLVPRDDSTAWLIVGAAYSEVGQPRRSTAQLIDDSNRPVGSGQLIVGDLISTAAGGADTVATLAFREAQPAPQRVIQLRSRDSFSLIAELRLPDDSANCTYHRYVDLAVRHDSDGTNHLAWVHYQTQGPKAVDGSCDLAATTGWSGSALLETVTHQTASGWGPIRKSAVLGPATSIIASGTMLAVEPWPCGDGWAVLLQDRDRLSLNRASLDLASVTPVTGTNTVGSINTDASRFASSSECSNEAGGAVTVVTGKTDGVGSTDPAQVAAAWSSINGSAWTWPIYSDGSGGPATARQLPDSVLPVRAQSATGHTWALGLKQDGRVMASQLSSQGSAMSVDVDLANQLVTAPSGLALPVVGGIVQGGAPLAIWPNGKGLIVASTHFGQVPLATLDAYRAAGETDHAVAVTYALGCTP